MTEAERKARVAEAIEWTATHHARNIKTLAEIERKERDMTDREPQWVNLHHQQKGLRVDYWPTAEEVASLFAECPRLVLDNGHMVVKDGDHYACWPIDAEWPEHFDGTVKDPMEYIEPLRKEAEAYAEEEAASQVRETEAAAARQAEADRLAKIEASRVVKVTEVVGHFHVESYEAMGIVDSDGGHMITFDELLPVGEGKRGRFKITVEFLEEDR